jgi:endonuclease/exonuclease/phosphatase family metal-dependent hydrolase
MKYTQLAFWLLLCSLACTLVARATDATEPQVEDLDPMPDQLVIATWNLEWFFDDETADNRSDLARAQSAPSRTAWQWKVNECARVIADIAPDILAVQEVENRKVLADLVNRLRERHNLFYRVAWAEGTDISTEQDVAILHRGGLIRYGRWEQTSTMFRSNRYYNVSKHLFAEFAWRHEAQSVRLLVCTAHLRAQPEQEAIRVRQARLLHYWVAPALRAGQDVLLLGDWNTEVLFGEAVQGRDLGVLMGHETMSVEDDLIDAHSKIADGVMQTHLSGRQYDRILLSRTLDQDDPQRRDWVLHSTSVRRDLVVRGRGPDGQEHFDNYYAIPASERDVSDHYPVVIVLKAH